MSRIFDWNPKSEKPTLKLDGKKIIIKRTPCYNYDKTTDTSFTYVEEVVYHFDSEDKAKEYYYKKR